MSELNLPPFYVGQKVVALKTSAVGFNRIVIKKGEILTVRKSYGQCVFFNEVVNKHHPDFAACDNYEAAYPASDFAPVQENFQSISLDKVLEKETHLISVN